jgi:hypothetical protein
MKAIFAMLVVLACVGCATKSVPATREVQVAVMVECVKNVPARPANEFEKLTTAASDGEKVIALARDYPRSQKYEGELVAVIEGCRSMTPQ